MHRGELSSITGLHPVDARNIFPVVTAQNVPGCSLNLRGGGGQNGPWLRTAASELPPWGLKEMMWVKHLARSLALSSFSGNGSCYLVKRVAGLESWLCHLTS